MKWDNVRTIQAISFIMSIVICFTGVTLYQNIDKSNTLSANEIFIYKLLYVFLAGLGIGLICLFLFLEPPMGAINLILRIMIPIGVGFGMANRVAENHNLVQMILVIWIFMIPYYLLIFLLRKIRQHYITLIDGRDYSEWMKNQKII